jgi:flagellar biogenesis protein FliO
MPYMDVALVVLSVTCAIAIVLYASWLLMHRLRRGEQKGKSFGEWLKHVFEAVWGL